MMQRKPEATAMTATYLFQHAGVQHQQLKCQCMPLMYTALCGINVME